MMKGSSNSRRHEKHLKELDNFVGRQVTLGIRPEDIYDKLYSTAGTAENTVTSTVDAVEVLGSEKLLTLKLAQSMVTVKVDVHNRALENQDVDAVFNMGKAHLFDKETQQSIVTE